MLCKIAEGEDELHSYLTIVLFGITERHVGLYSQFTFVLSGIAEGQVGFAEADSEEERLLAVL